MLFRVALFPLMFVVCLCSICIPAVSDSDVVSSKLDEQMVATEKMIKVVMRSIRSDLPEGSFARSPKTTYRVGSLYARVEEMPDAAAKIHGLIITNNRDTWMINLYVNSAYYFKDKDDGESFEVHMPLISLGKNVPKETRKILDHFEIGNEIAFMKEHSAKEELVELEGKKLTSFDLKIEGYDINLMATVSSPVPHAVMVSKDGKILVASRYDEYITNLEPDMSLFNLPEGIEVVKEVILGE